LYTAMIYQGPYLVAAIKKDLATRLRSDGFTSLQAAVGSA
jgi:dihydroorotate dehydrogenase